jgi:hypothetical protein
VRLNGFKAADAEGDPCLTDSLFELDGDLTFMINFSMFVLPPVREAEMAWGIYFRIGAVRPVIISPGRTDAGTKCSAGSRIYLYVWGRKITPALPRPPPPRNVFGPDSRLEHFAGRSADNAGYRDLTIPGLKLLLRFN